ncbi:MAG: hypothetical protein CVV52_13605 [Spirochaetae bacterium HGW-Spirochaetae-8]|nr:MAG: hypothetical protein CVV52_13605 [Spirochaetae bacterium HGW-Spirochaetae-8]
MMRHVLIPQRSEQSGSFKLSAPTRYLGGTAWPSGRCGVRSRSRPSDQALRVLAAPLEPSVSFVPGTNLIPSL